jgi:predicted cupin superfamily sugar epimerase
MPLSAREVIDRLGLTPHPEGGYYRETFRDTRLIDGRRSASSHIYYLLDVGDVSEWHRIDAVEVWHHYAGAPVVLTVSENGHDAQATILGPDIMAGQRPCFAVPAQAWQTCTSLGEWSLMGCTVAPGFEFSGFEMAEPGWRPVPRVIDAQS